MNTETLLRELSTERPSVPVKVLHEAAQAQRAAVWPELLACLQRCNLTPHEITDADFLLAPHALYLGTLWNAPELAGEVVQLLEVGRDDDDWLDEFFGEIGHDLVPALLALTFDGRLEPFRGLILHERERSWIVTDWIARAALSLWATDKLTHAQALTFFKSVVQAPSFWNEMESASWFLFNALELEPAAFVESCAKSTAWQRVNLKPPVFTQDDVKAVLRAPVAERKAVVLENHERAMADWKEWIESLSDVEPVSAEDVEGLPNSDLNIAAARFPSVPPSPQPLRAGPKTGPNDPCPCGSGRKFKKCCGV